MAVVFAELEARLIRARVQRQGRATLEPAEPSNWLTYPTSGLERRLDRAAGPGLHRPDPTELPARRHDRRSVGRLVPRAAHEWHRRPGRPFVRRFRHHERRARGRRREGARLRRRVHARRGRDHLRGPGRLGVALAVPDPTTVLDVVGYPGAPEGDADAYLSRTPSTPPLYRISPRPTGRSGHRCRLGRTRRPNDAEPRLPFGRWPAGPDRDHSPTRGVVHGIPVVQFDLSRIVNQALSIAKPVIYPGRDARPKARP